VAHLVQQCDRICRRRRNALQIVEGLRLLRRRVGRIKRGPKLTERRIVLAPTKPDQSKLRLSLLDLFGRLSLGPAAGVSAVKNEMGNFFGMANRVGDRYRPAL